MHQWQSISLQIVALSVAFTDISLEDTPHQVSANSI